MIYDGRTKHGRHLDNLESTVRATTKSLREVGDEFDVIAASGLSGVTVASPVALRLKKPLVIVRKDVELDRWRHKDKPVINVGHLAKDARVLFLDDFVAAGDTRDWVRQQIETHGDGAKLVAQYMYDVASSKAEFTLAGYTRLQEL